MVTKRGICVWCGKEFTYESQARNGGPRKYCSPACHNHKLAHNRESAVLNKCQNCGKEFVVRGQSPRANCSTECEIADIRRQAAVLADSESRAAFSEWVVSLCLGGYSRKAVKEALNISNTTLRYWTKVHTGKTPDPQCRHWCVNDFRKAESPDEWLRILRADVIPPEGKVDFIDGRQVFLISGAVKWLGCADSLSSVVYGRLQMNPFDGSIYVFCNANFDKIRCLYSNGTGLSVLTHIRERGKYLWPQPKVGAVVSATPQDLELILHGGHKRLVMRKDDWDKLRL